MRFDLDDNRRTVFIIGLPFIGELTDVQIPDRNIRRDCNEAAKKQKADGDLTEDGLKKLEKNNKIIDIIQDIHDDSISVIEDEFF